MMGVVDTLVTISGVELPSKLAEIATEAAAAAKREERDPIRALLNIALDKELIVGFEPPLGAFGFKLIERQLIHPFADTTPRMVTVVLRPPVELYLVGVPSWLLKKPEETHVAAFTHLSYLFKRNSIIYIVARGLDEMDSNYLDMTSTLRAERSIDVKLVAWVHVAKLLKTTSLDAQKKIVRRIFSIDELEKRTEELETRTKGLSSAAPTALSFAERQAIIKILSGKASDPFDSSTEYFKKLVGKAEFNGLTQFRWENKSETDAQNLVSWAADTIKAYPRRRDRAGQSTLGRLAMTLIDDENLDLDDEQTLAKIILDHNLIRDDERIKTLFLLVREGGALGQ
jgi:hypothetical protein